MWFYEAERLRLLAQTAPPGAEPRAMLREAWELAHRQGALLFELRAALDLARQARIPTRRRDWPRSWPGSRPAPATPSSTRHRRCWHRLRPGHDGAATGARPRRRHGRPGRGVAALGARLAGAVLLDHGAGAGFRLGGKGASSRGEHGRVEEHGLHVWLGHYDNAFRVMRECYGELDRDRTAPSCPIRGWRDAFLPTGALGLFDRDPGGWEPWVAKFSTNRLLPGEPDADGRAPSVAELLLRSALLLRDFYASLEPGRPRTPVLLSLSPSSPRRRRRPSRSGRSPRRCWRSASSCCCWRGREDAGSPVPAARRRSTARSPPARPARPGGRHRRGRPEAPRPGRPRPGRAGRDGR